MLFTVYLLKLFFGHEIKEEWYLSRWEIARNWVDFWSNKK